MEQKESQDVLLRNLNISTYIKLKKEAKRNGYLGVSTYINKILDEYVLDSAMLEKEKEYKKELEKYKNILNTVTKDLKEEKEAMNKLNQKVALISEIL